MLPEQTQTLMSKVRGQSLAISIQCGSPLQVIFAQGCPSYWLRLHQICNMVWGTPSLSLLPSTSSLTRRDARSASLPHPAPSFFIFRTWYFLFLLPHSIRVSASWRTQTYTPTYYGHGYLHLQGFYIKCTTFQKRQSAVLALTSESMD